MQQGSEGCIQLRRGKGNEGNGARHSLKCREDVEVGAKCTESQTSIVRSPYRDLKLPKVSNAYACWLDADISVTYWYDDQMGVSERCCILFITHVLVVGDHILFNVHM